MDTKSAPLHPVKKVEEAEEVPADDGPSPVQPWRFGSPRTPSRGYRDGWLPRGT